MDGWMGGWWYTGVDTLLYGNSSPILLSGGFEAWISFVLVFAGACQSMYVSGEKGLSDSCGWSRAKSDIIHPLTP